MRRKWRGVVREVWVEGQAATEEEDWRLALDAASALLHDLQALPALHVSTPLLSDHSLCSL
eukprot:1429207-Rhodomonas_salina.1